MTPILLLAIACASAPMPPVEEHAYRVVVRRVIDGDTIVADVELGWDIWMIDQHIRIKRCWAPEMKEARGPAAKTSLESILDADLSANGFQSGATLLFVSGTAKSLGEREKYGRLLGELYRDGKNVGAEQVRRGHATVTPIKPQGGG